MSANTLLSEKLYPGVTLWKPEEDLLDSLDIIPQDESCSEVLLGLPVGECGGVKMANEVIRQLGRAGFGAVYGNHEPTHGADSTAELVRLGAKFGEDPASIPLGMPYVVSAHGAAPGVPRAARERGLNVYDVTCPLVHKTHLAINRAAEEEDPLVAYISFGSPNHAERIGAAGIAKELEIPFSAIGSKEEVDQLLKQLEGSETLVVVGQTTNNSDDADKLASYLSDKGHEVGVKVKREGAHDVCHTVRDRQRSTREIIRHGVGSLVVVGSVNSKNTKSLALVGAQQAERLDVELDIYLTNSWFQLPELGGSVGVVSGASTREQNVKGVIARLAPKQGITIIGVDTDKDIVFKPVDGKTRQLLA